MHVSRRKKKQESGAAVGKIKQDQQMAQQGTSVQKKMENAKYVGCVCVCAG